LKDFFAVVESLSSLVAPFCYSITSGAVSVSLAKQPHGVIRLFEKCRLQTSKSEVPINIMMKGV
jgi:hypothetical protein